MNIKKELPFIVIVLLPFLYLAYIWNQLPAKVPVHWNVKGDIDRYGDKAELILIPLLLPLLVYVIFLVVPRIDPKKKLDKMGNKLQNLKLLMTTLMSMLALFILYSAQNQSFDQSNYLFILIGILYIILGNYSKIIKPNYFIGIRTPWTLESESVWKETHKLGGKLWFIGGIIVVLSGFILGNKPNLIVFLTITTINAIVPIVYSYMLFKKNSIA